MVPHCRSHPGSHNDPAGRGSPGWPSGHSLPSHGFQHTLSGVGIACGPGLALFHLERAEMRKFAVAFLHESINKPAEDLVQHLLLVRLAMPMS